MIRIKIFNLFLFFSISLSISVNSQLKTDLENINLGFNISPVYEISRINKFKADFIGIKMGLISQNSEIGISLLKLNSTLTHDITYITTRLKFDIFGGEIYYNYYYKIYNQIFLSIGTSVGSAYTQLLFMENTREPGPGPPGCWKEVFASDTYLYFKPQLNFDFNVFEKLLLNIGMGYRITIGFRMDYRDKPETINYSDKDFNDFFFAISIKYIIVLI
jgi:hypothetical protein